MVRHLADQPRGAEHRRQQHIAHRWRQLDPARLRAAEMDGQVELVGIFDRRLGEALPAFDMTAGLWCQGEIDEDPDPEWPPGGFRL